MSLFGNDQYRWRETYFVLFKDVDRLAKADWKKLLQSLGAGYAISDISRDEEGDVESLTVLSAADYAGMDISYVTGEEVEEQIEELTADLRVASLTKIEKAKLLQLREFNARYDIYFFQQVTDDGEDDEDDVIDPASLLAVLERLARLCHGVAVDPQSGTIM